MSNTNDGQNMVEETTEAMPTSEQPAEEVQPQDELPDGVSERTRAAFEKLKLHNQQLAEQVGVLEGAKTQSNSVLDDLLPSTVAEPTASAPTAVHQQTQDQFVDNEGYVDPALLNAQLAEARRQAQEARDIALETQKNIQNFQETETVRRLHEAHPELDPKSTKFDPKFYGYVKNDLMGQLATGKRNPFEAAKRVLEFYKPAQPQAVVNQVEQQKIISQRELASAPTSTSKSTPPQADNSQLVAGTYKGNAEAIYARLQASGN